MNITDVLFNLLPPTVVRKNKSFNLVVKKVEEAGEERVLVGYESTDKKGKTETLQVSNMPSNYDGLKNAMKNTIKDMMVQGWQAMGYEIKSA